ncbi:sensor domain-containing diguanylate cyclase [Paenibacillus brevis]|uniref:Sensor domain-containing diguanylate cyclase n=1 Tax=Paenibacillus brevis TaxID=2841508 RepID=A0ABS6FKR6_9BACL|nr:sensor domain-containing diguanylate cyclase [Paenibacillus brevis]MBU5670782.1 sensor domain-containing diguanylate cyclase [Paenibacillus brevis]
MSKLQETQRRNMLMIKLVWGFYIITVAVNLIVDQSVYVLNPPVGLLLGVVLTFLIMRRIAPEATMLLLITALYTFLLLLTIKHPFVVNMIFLGLLPMITLLYMNLKATLLSGTLYTVTSSYLFLLKHDDLFPGADKTDVVYFMIYGVFACAFSILFTKFVQSIWKGAQQNARQLGHVLDSVDIATWTLDMNEDSVLVSEGITQITGYPAEHFRTSYLALTGIVIPEDQYLIAQAQKELLINKRSVTIECRIQRVDGYYRWIQVRGTPHYNDYGHLERLDGVIIDITERKQLEDRVAYLAYHDELTTLPKRALFNMQFERCIEEGISKLTVLFIDLDNFKEVNDAYGHSAGDMLLKEIAGRLSGIIRDSDMVCRLGGDEFLLLLVGSDARDASRVAERIIESLSRPFYYMGCSLIATPSIGICAYEGGPCDLDSMIRRADEAMYEAKREGRNQYSIFTEITEIAR